MFNLIAQYIGYGTDTDVAECKNVQDPKFGVVEEGDWTVVDLTSIADVTSKRGNTTDDGYQCVDTPEKANSMDWSMSESIDSRVRDLPAPQQVAVPSDRRLKCAKSNKRNSRVTPNLFPQCRPNQMKRYNQAFCQRSSRTHQKMRQIVHQPRKY